MGTDRSAAAWAAAATLAAGAVVVVLDPNQPGHYPVCPTRFLTGLDCPLCGTLRGLHDLSRGHVASALDHNVLLVVTVPLLLWIWIRWVRTAASGRPAPALPSPRWAVPVMVSVAVAFTVVRNLSIPGLTWLDAG